MPKVFISYKSDDLGVAVRVRQAIDRHYGFTAYLDRIDDALLQDGPGLADQLLQRIDECDQLLAVVGERTKESWWVPWEIGVGTEKHYYLATYSERYVQLPSYLKKWPALHSTSDIDRYCQMSQREHGRLRVAKASAVYLSEQEAASRRSASDFHRELRLMLGQT